MVSTNNGTLLPYAMKLNSSSSLPNPFALHPSLSQAALELQRAQIYDYNARLYGMVRGLPGPAMHPYPHNPHDPIAQALFQAKFDPRTRLMHEEPKPQQSYIGLIAMAILSSKDRKLILSDIYQWILDNYQYFRTRGPGWRNSIRHNLSLNDCFIKAGRSANGKGHYWAIHPANIDDFKKGDFRRRKAQRRVRKAMGLSVPDEEESPSPPPNNNPDVIEWRNKMLLMEQEEEHQKMMPESQEDHLDLSDKEADGMVVVGTGSGGGVLRRHEVNNSGTKKRLFDMDSLLAPDNASGSKSSEGAYNENLEDIKSDDEDEFIDVDSKDDDDARDLSLHSTNSDNNENRKSDLNVSTPRKTSSPHSDGRPSPSTPTLVSPIRVNIPGEVRRELKSPASIGSPAERPRGPWASPLSAHLPSHRATSSRLFPGESTHVSAFHAAVPSTNPAAWANLSHAFPGLSPYPLGAPLSGSSAAEALAAHQRWQETFSRMVARSQEASSDISTKVDPS